jgi:NAD(P)-dependent dehydrogenase (short-subunit alcohol dehydrogenase family)
MSERVAIVVGAGCELGRTTAEKLAAAQSKVVGVDRNEAALKELPDGIRQAAGDPAVAVSLVDNAVAPQLLDTARTLVARGGLPGPTRGRTDRRMGAAAFVAA